MTPNQLLERMPLAGARARQFAEPLTNSMVEFDIDSPKRDAAFLAQVCHESGSLRYTLELSSGNQYEGREDLGNTQPGDGPKYRGRGLLQVTGRANYAACGSALGLDLLAQPELLEVPLNACRSAGWFWQSRKLNRFADADQFGALTRAVNGGYTGLDERIQHWLRIRKLLGL